MLTLALPWALLLLPLPWLIRPRHTGEVDVPRLPFADRLAGLPGVGRHRQQRLPLETALLVLAWLALVLAIARPQHLGEEISQTVSGRDLLLAVDISPSMEAEDMVLHNRPANRLQAVKQVVDDFLTQRQGDRVGLILFGTQPYLQVPLTFDLATLKTLLYEAQLGMAGDATAIGDALGLAIKRLRERPADQRVVILLTDGANTAGEMPPPQAAKLAADNSVRVYTIGIGAETMVQRSLFGNRQINPSRDLDEALLRSIAEQTNAHYYRARSLPELELAYAAINELERIELDSLPYRPVSELFHWPLGAALILWLFNFVFKRADQWLDGRVSA